MLYVYATYKGLTAIINVNVYFVCFRFKNKTTWLSCVGYCESVLIFRESVNRIKVQLVNCVCEKFNIMKMIVS